MAVDTNIYGTSEQWVNTYYQQTALTNKNKKAWFGGNTAQTQLRGGVTSGKLSYSQPIDKTLAYCGFSTVSALSHRAYIGRDNDNNFKILEYQDSGVSNWAFFEKTTEYGATNYPDNMGYIRLDDLGRTAWNNSINDDWNISKYIEPYTFVNPHNMVLLIKVVAGTSLYNSQSMDLSTYISNRANYPYLYAVYGDLYFGTLPERSLNAGKGTPPSGWKTSTLQCLDNYVCNAKNINIPMYSVTYSGSCILMGNPERTRNIYNDRDILNIFYICENGKNHIKIETSGTDKYCYIEYYDGLIDDILKTAACFGLYFTTVENVAKYGAPTNNNMYIGLIDGDGVGRGRYLQGADTVNAPQAASDFDNMHKTNYNPYEQHDNTKYDNSTHFNLNLSLGAFTKFYQLTESQVNDLCRALYDVVNAQPSGTSIEEYNMKCFLTNNPIDCIISLKKFPLNHFPSVGVPNDLYLGTVDTGIDAPLVLSTTWIYYFDFSNSSDTGLFAVNGGSFLDFEPYTTIQINVPFCGSFEVPTTYFHKYGGVRVALMIDFITGACTAYLIVNNDVVDSVSGSCSVDLPVTGLQSATLDGNIHNASMMKEKQQTSLLGGLIAGAVSIGVGLATGSLPLAVGGGAAIIGSFMNAEDTGKQINYNVEHMQLPLKQVGAASGAIAQCNDYRCKMIIKRPVLMTYDKEVYAKTIGYACLLNGIVDNFTGLTIGKIEAETIQNGITDEERTMIESLFASGVIL